MKKIAILGKKETYSEHAANLFIASQQDKLDKVYYKTTKEVVYSLEQGIDYAILPFENTLEGYVNQHMDLLIEQKVSIISEVFLNIRFNYVSNTNNPKRLYVQYVAKNQCLSWIEKHDDLEIIMTESNTESLELMLNDDLSAAIIPYHLAISRTFSYVNEDVSDNLVNHTRFLILTKDNVQITDDAFKQKATLLIKVNKDKPGLLYEILREFANRNMSLISIMSRPTKYQIGTYHFFIELYINIDLNEQDKLKEIEELFQLTILGIYTNIEA